MILYHVAQLWNFRVRTIQYSLQEQIQKAFAKNVVFFQKIYIPRVHANWGLAFGLKDKSNHHHFGLFAHW